MHDPILAGALLAVWLLLLIVAVAAHNAARTVKRREFWRSIMAGLVGLAGYRRKER